MMVCIKAVRDAGKVAEVCLCYTSDVLTSKIYTLDYYKDLTKKLVDAGAHIIAIKDMAGLLKPLAAAPLMKVIREVTDLPFHFHTHATSGGSLATAIEMAKAGCNIVDFATASMSEMTSQPSLNAFLAVMKGDACDPGIDYLAAEPYDMYWSKLREMYLPFECGMKAGTARVYDHEIPGGQYSNLMVQCAAMGIWEKWEEVLDMYRDVNIMFGDIVKVTPSSKCVGDLAIYLVNRGLPCDDVKDPSKAAAVDFPTSVIEFMEGRLGFPHHGFPDDIAKNILKGRPQLKESPSASLPQANFGQEKENLRTKFNFEPTDEDVISSLLYPKVFADYRKYLATNGNFVTYLQTPVHFYGMNVGMTTTFALPSSMCDEAAATPSDKEEMTEVTMSLTRIGPQKKDSYRTLYFLVNGEPQEVEIQDASGDDAFIGPMADKSNLSHVGSPMPGAIDKLLVAEGASVSEGEKLAVIVAMKMEIVVKAPRDGKIGELFIEEGSKVIEGALLLTLDESN